MFNLSMISHKYFSFVYFFDPFMSSPPKNKLEKIILKRKAEINETLIQELLVELWDYDGKFIIKLLN